MEEVAPKVHQELLRKDESWWVQQLAPLFQNYGFEITNMGGIKKVGAELKGTYLHLVQSNEEAAEELFWGASLADRTIPGNRVRTHFVQAAVPLVLFARLYL